MPSSASTTGDETAHAVRRSMPSYRSCQTCHRRKIRCDKREPCSTCSRANASCIYPSPDQRIKRPRKTTMAGVASRLSDLERLIPSMAPATGQSVHTGSVNPSRSSRKETDAASHAHEGCSVDAVSMENQQAFGNEILVQRGSRSQYFSEGFIARVIEKVRRQRPFLRFSHHILTEP